MEITGMESIIAMRATTAAYIAQKKETEQVNSSASQGDTVTISSEAKRLAEYFRNVKTGAQEGTQSSQTDQSGTEGNGSPSTSQNSTTAIDAKKTEGTSGGSPLADGTAQQIEDIKKRIKELKERVKQIMDGDLPDEQKQSVAAPYLQQIQQLEQQLQQLETDQAKQAQG